MSHADPGPLASYNSLQDKHLAGYFSNSRMKRHLKRSGLVTKGGKIIDEKTYRLNMAKKEHRKHVRDLLATAIVHKTLDVERVRQYEIRKRLDDIYKVELVRRVKEGRKRKGDEDILPLLSPRERTAHLQRKAAKDKYRERPSTAPAVLEDSTTEDEGPIQPSEIYYDDDTQKIYYRVENPSQTNGYLKDETEELGPSPYTRAYPATYPAPAPPPSGTPRRSRTAGTPRRGVKLQRFHYLARTEPAVARRVQLQSMAEVTMKFLGPSLILTNSMFPEDRLSEVMVLQQHCGGSTLCVFRELLPPNTIFTFISRRHRGAPFGLTFYIDGMQDIRLSSCCEYKHKPGHILGGKNGHFQFVMVEGAAPCYRCQIASAHKGHKSKHRASRGNEEDERNKTFLTEAVNEQEQEEGEEEGQVFDVIITKIKPPGDDDADQQKDGDMVDNSTQTPRDEDSGKPEEEVTIEEDDATGAAPDNPEQADKEGEVAEAAEESGADKYDDDEFEESPEKDKEKESESGPKEETDNENNEAKNNEDYKEDFESDEEKEKENGDGEEPDKESDKESDKKSDKESDDESDKSDNESDKESNKSDNESDKGSDKKSEKSDQGSDKEEEPEEEIQDETEDKQPGKQEEADEVDEVEEETDGRKDESSNRPGSAASSEGKQSKNVSFDEDVTVFEDEKDEVPEEEQTQNHEESTVDKEEEVPDETEESGAKADEEENKDGIDAEETVRSPEPDDSSSSSSSSSSSESESSDSEDEEKSDGDNKITGHDPGSDPDLVSTGQLPDQALKAVGVKPGAKHEGSVQTLLEGKEDIDIAGVELTKDQFEEVAKILDAREELGSFILRNTGTDDSSLEILVDPLKNSHHLRMLNLSVNSIGPDGAKHVAEIIRENKSLKMLLLHANPLADKGVQVIIEAILENPSPSLMNLDLGDCGLTQDGAQHIARLIENNNSITILTISGNSIQLEGWQKISKALSSNTSIENLSLDFNKIGDAEAIVIAEGLQRCKSLRSVDLEGNKIGDNGGRRLFEAVKLNKSIVDLTLVPMNQISREIVDEIKEFLDQRAKGNEPEDAEQNNQDIGEDPQPDKGSAEQSQDKQDRDEEAEKGGDDTREEQEATENEQQRDMVPESSDGQVEQGDNEERKEETNEPASSSAEEGGNDSLEEDQPERQPKADEVSQPADGTSTEEATYTEPSKEQETVSAENDESEKKIVQDEEEGEKERGPPENDQEQSGEAAKEGSEQKPLKEASSDLGPSPEAPSERGPSQEAPSEQEPLNEAPSEQEPSNEVPSERGPSNEVPSEQEPSNEAPSEQEPSNELPSERGPSNEVPSEQGPSDEQPSENSPSDKGSLGEDSPKVAPSEGEKEHSAPSDLVPSVDDKTREESPVAAEETRSEVNNV